MWKTALKIAIGSIGLALLILITLYYLLGIFYGISINLQTGEPYKILKDTPTLKIYRYMDRFEVRYYVVPNLTDKQILFVNAHYKDNKTYTLVDANGTLWYFGKGVRPEPTWVTVTYPAPRINLSMLILDKSSYYDYYFDVPTGTYVYKCIWVGLNGARPFIALSGQVGGTEYTQVDWWVIKNNLAYELEPQDLDYYNLTWNDFDENSSIRVSFMWVTSYDVSKCYLPAYGQNAISLDLSKEDWQFNTSLGPALAIQNQLPSNGNYTFIMYEQLPLKWANGTVEYITRIYYDNSITVGTGGTEPKNPLLRAIWNMGVYLKNALKGLASLIVAGLKAFYEEVLPQPLKDLLSSVWNIFSLVKDIFLTMVDWMLEFSDLFKLFVLLIPLIAVVITIYDPTLTISFFMWGIEVLRKIVQIVRSLIPI